MNLRYVFSAPSMLRMHPNELTDSISYTDIVSTGIKRLTQLANKELPEGYSLKTDILFNAYAEKNFGNFLKSKDNFGFEKLYADSGGLQVVTRGHKLTDELKKDIYKTQSVADYAFCFDEIPTKSLSLSSQNRSSISDKLFFGDDLKQCAIKTAENINEQCNELARLNSDTKVFYIIQGNTLEDMVQWFSQSEDVLDSYDRLIGLAMADTCMGNGQLESVDMLGSYVKLTETYGVEKTKNHIHLLGVGSVSRLMPFLCGKNMMRDDVTISFDSTSISMGFMMGKCRNLNGDFLNATNYKPFLNEIMSIVDDKIKYYHKDIDIELFISKFISNSRSLSDTVYESNNPHLSNSIVSLIIISQLILFCKELKKIVDNLEKRNDPFALLTKCKNYNDYSVWRNKFKPYIKSNRITRKDIDLSDFFE